MNNSLLLFDHDGVLVDTEKWYYQAKMDVLEGVKISLDFFATSAKEALVIEDSERGLRAANAAGIDCVTVKK